MRQCFLCNQSCTKHHCRVGRVGARRDGRDNNVPMRQGVAFTIYSNFYVFGVFTALQIECVVKGTLHICHCYPYVGQLGPRKARYNRGQIKFQQCRELRIRCICFPPHSLRFGIGLNQSYCVCWSIGQSQVIDGFVIYREKSAGCAIFWRHVCNGRAISKR